MSDELLDTIDHVLHDYDTGTDAMRWTPAPVAAAPIRIDIGHWIEPIHDPQAMLEMTRALASVVGLYEPHSVSDAGRPKRHPLGRCGDPDCGGDW